MSKVKHRKRLAQLEEIVQTWEGTSDDSSLAAYRDDPDGFIRDVLRADLIFEQEVAACAVRDHRRVSTRSSHGYGKDFLASALALWAAYARGMRVIVTSASERQVKKILIAEIRAHLNRARVLPGVLLQSELRIGDEAMILGFTTNEISKATGFHSPTGTLLILSEAQGVEDEHYTALLMNLTGDEDRLLAVGNALTDHGWFYDSHMNPRSPWKRFRWSGLDHPNIRQQRQIVPGAINQTFIDEIAREFGEASQIYRARVLAEFPTQSEDALFTVEMLERAAELHDGGSLYDRAMKRSYLNIGFDPARSGDQCVVAIRRGPVLYSLEVFDPLGDAIAVAHTAGRIVDSWLSELRATDPILWTVPSGYTLTVDSVGLGAPILDELRRRAYHALGFHGSGRPGDADPDDPIKFGNARAYSYWTLRRKLEAGELALPRDGKLWEELLAIRYEWKDGKLWIVDKREIKKRIGRSPDRADSLMLTFAGETFSPGGAITYGGAAVGGAF